MAISLSWLKESELFSIIIKKITINEKLTSKEMDFILSCAIIFFDEYSKDKRRTPYFEIAYYITLKCAINNDYYDPLLDASSNFGFYPVAKYIIRNNLSTASSYSEFSLDYQLEKFKKDQITETYEQKKHREDMIESNSEENCYIAPTSFGKSSLIIDIIKAKKPHQAAVIVPTKSLLIQTYKLLKTNFPKAHIIFHDEMYENNGSFLSVLTQERALRLLKNQETSFDLMIIDEAHNLFEMDGRSILLTRLIRRNRIRNPSSKNYYLSPLISDTDNLRTEENQKIFERRIASNIKEPDISEFRTNGEIFAYNRFLNDFYYKETKPGFIRYIIENRKEKNFLYLRSPRKVEELSMQLSAELPNLNSNELNELSQTVSNNVHSDFYCVDHIKKGLIYLHGKLPDLIKEYLEHKFAKTKQLKFITANSVILEGVNLPIDNLYILNTYTMHEKSLTNLIGRVNRLNEVFDDQRKSLAKLLPSIHFVNSDEFNRKDGKMENQIRLLRKGTFKDEVKNPLLLNFNPEKLFDQLEKQQDALDQEKIEILERRIKTFKEVQDRENFLINNDGDDSSKVKRALMESGISSIYSDPDYVCSLIENRINTITTSNDWADADVIEKVYLFFIKSLEHEISDAEFLRLQRPKARDFYRLFTTNLHRLNLKDHISDMVRYFQTIKTTESGKEFYIGGSYGEFSKTSDSGAYSKNVYIDLSNKTEKELVNLALVKIKIESDFVSYRLNEFISALYDFNMISERDYNLQIYGTTKKTNAEFVKIGLSGALINKLERDKQIENISINEFGAVDYNNKFVEYINKQDDLMQFEIGKYININ